MRADRLLSILLLLQVRQRVTAGELARRLEVSERTIYRDMDALSSAGIPVFAERGHGGGWGLVGRYQTDLTGLNKAEIEALFLQPSGLLADLGLDKASTTALIKLLAALPSTRRQDAEHVRQRIHVDGAGWFQAKESVSIASSRSLSVPRPLTTWGSSATRGRRSVRGPGWAILSTRSSRRSAGHACWSSSSRSPWPKTGSW